MKLIATKPISEQRARALTYSTRMLVPGDDFETRKDVYGRVLIATRKARSSAGPIDRDAADQGGGSIRQPAPDDLARLRAEYQQKFGKRPFHGWTVAQLVEKIAAA